MRNPFSRQTTTTSDTGCCAPLTFEQEPAGDEPSAAGCCAPATETPGADAGAELPARDREAASA